MISDLLLDVDVAVDLVSRREPHGGLAEKVVGLATSENVRLWLYTGSVSRLESEATQAFLDQLQASGDDFAPQEAAGQARRALDDLSHQVQWLAALAGEGPVFGSDDPHARQLLSAVARLGDSARLLTRQEVLLGLDPDRTMHPKTFLAQGAGGSRPIPFINLTAQQDRIRPRLEQNLHRVLHHGRYIMGDEVGELEGRLADFVGVEQTVACASGTDALLLALMACGVGPGDAVFTSPFTFIATAEVIALLGATPVFVDIDPSSLAIDPAQLEKAVQAVQSNDPHQYPLPAVQGRGQLIPRAVMPVDLFGLPAEYDLINRTATRYGLWVIEDAAQSLGAEYHGRKAGALGDIGCTSFFPAKPLGGYGDGGAAFTDNQELAAAMRSLAVHGTGQTRYDHDRIGLNARLDSLQAAVLLPKLEILPEEIGRRQRVAAAYSRLITERGLDLQVPSLPQGLSSAWAQYSVLARDEEHRRRWQQSLGRASVPTAVYYPKPLHMQRAFTGLGYRPEDMPISLAMSERIFSLPMHPYLAETEILRIVKAMDQAEGA